MFLVRSLAVLVAVVATTAFATATAAAQQPPHPGNTIGLELKRFDPASRTIEAVQHCTDPASAGKLATFKMPEGIDFSQGPPNAMFGAAIDRSTTPPTVRPVGPPPCQLHPGGPGSPGGPGGDFRSGPGGPPCGPGGPPPHGGRPAAAAAGLEGCGTPAFQAGFLSRVWKFEGEVDGFANGKLSYTIGKVLNLPKRMRNQDDELLDEDAIVLVGKDARVIKGSKRVSAQALEDANRALVHGKLLPPSKWQEDADGEPTPTIRAKKVHITG